jgi:hypothetical protein
MAYSPLSAKQSRVLLSSSCFFSFSPSVLLWFLLQLGVQLIVPCKIQFPIGAFGLTVVLPMTPVLVGLSSGQSAHSKSPHLVVLSPFGSTSGEFGILLLFLSDSDHLTRLTNSPTYLQE